MTIPKAAIADSTGDQSPSETRAELDARISRIIDDAGFPLPTSAICRRAWVSGMRGRNSIQRLLSIGEIELAPKPAGNPRNTMRYQARRSGK